MGTPLGAAEDRERRIDSLAQTWVVLKGVAAAAHAEQALHAVRFHLVRRACSCSSRRSSEARSIRAASGAVFREFARTALSARMPRRGSCSRTPTDTQRCKLEPHVLAGDIDVPTTHRGRSFELQPCIACSWPTFSIEGCVGRSRPSIQLDNLERVCRDVASAILDG